RERFRAEDAGTLPGTAREELERGDGVDRGLPDDRLRAVLAHRRLVVGDVVEVGPARPAVAAEAGDEGPGARLAAHALAESGRIRERSRDDVARSDLDTLDRDLLLRVEAELVQGLEHLDELAAEPVLERDALALDPARHEEHLLVLDVHAFDRPDALWEVEDLRLGERLGREPAALLLPDHGRVQALLDGRPDGEGRREVVAFDHEIGAVSDADLVDLGEELVGGVTGEDVGGAWLDPDTYQREQALLLPRGRS